MTGFGRGAWEQGGHGFVVELRSVNHRYCDVRISAPGEHAWVAPQVEAAIRDRVARGRIEGLIRHRAVAAPPALRVDRGRAMALAEEVAELARELGQDGRWSLDSLLTAPGVIDMAPEAALEDAAIRSGVLSATQDALGQLVDMRNREGELLCGALARGLEEVRGVVSDLAYRFPAALKERQEKARARIEALLGDAEVFEPQRIAQELAIMAERADLSEELERLRAHAVRFDALLQETEPAGRRLDFLIQEMNREANTVGSKSADTEMAHNVINLKAALERLREQVQNLE